MPLNLQIDPSTGIAVGAYDGIFDLEASKQALFELWSRPDWKGRAAVWDMRLARLEVTAEDVRAFARFALENQPAVPPSRVAFVTDDELNFGLMRMFEVYREDPRTETRVLRDLDEAITWAKNAPFAPGLDAI